LDKQRLLQIAGFIWVIVGLFLVYRGSDLYKLAVIEQNTSNEILIISIILGVVLGTL